MIANIELEKSFISQLLLDSDVGVNYSDTEDDIFTDSEFKKIFNTIKLCQKKHTDYDISVLSNELYKTNPLTKWTDTLVNLCSYEITSALHEQVYSELLELKKKRNALLKIEEAKILISKDRIEEGYNLLSKIPLTQYSDDFNEGLSSSLAKDILLNTLTNPKDLQKERIDTGINELDRALGSLRRGEIYTIAARPGMGKTTLLLNIANNIKNNEEYPFVIFSLEMPMKTLEVKRMSLISEIPLKVLERDKNSRLLTQEEIVKLNTLLKAESLMPNQIIYFDKPSLNSQRIINSLKKIKLKYGGISGFAVDHMGLLKFNAKNRRDLEISDSLVDFKAISKELNCTGLILSQLNREVEKRDSYEPIMSDLKDSGGFEEHSAGIAFIYKDRDSKRYIKVAKSRFGELTKFPISFDGTIAKFSEFQ
ncbi:MAG: hypothetical protein GY909_15770 [Oligoflexia bacterium]|nr:hypothetical protein [Oligoflexia bacterium]